MLEKLSFIQGDLMVSSDFFFLFYSLFTVHVAHECILYPGCHLFEEAVVLDLFGIVLRFSCW